MERTDRQETRDVAFRRSVVMAGGVSLWLAEGSLLYIAWALGYILLDVVYLLLIVRTGRKSPVGRRDYLFLMTLQVIVSLWISGMIVHVAGHGDLVTFNIAWCGLAALALHCIANNDTWSHVTTSNVLNVSFATVGLTVQVYRSGISVPMAISATLIAAAVLAYFLHSFTEIMRTRARLSARHEAEAQAEKMQAIGQLTAGVAHDFNNLLTVIRGNLDLFEAVEDPHERARFLDEARAGTDRAAYLVKQLLAFSRKSQLSVSVVSVSSILRDSVAMLERVLPATIALDLAPVPADARIEVDRALLSTAILNAALNARDAMHPGGGVLSLFAEVHEAEVAFVIEDTGPGLPDDLFDRVTDPFFTTKPAGSGSGLGLSMIKGFAEQSGGRLELANRPRGGFSVRIMLPRLAVSNDTGAVSGATPGYRTLSA